jgi:hypothetical protein
METNLNNLAAYCKKMYADGYKNKQIHLVTKMPDSVISRILNGHTYKQVQPNDITRSSIIEDRIHVLNVLLECNEIGGGMGLDNNNKIYIQILKKVGADFAKVQELYYDISKKSLRNAWTYPAGNIMDFDGKHLNLTALEIIDLLKETEDM